MSAQRRSRSSRSPREVDASETPQGRSRHRFRVFHAASLAAFFICAASLLLWFLTPQRVGRDRRSTAHSGSGTPGRKSAAAVSPAAADAPAARISPRELAQRAEGALAEGRLSAAEADLRQLLQMQPDQPAVMHQLARLLRLQGRRWESIPLFLQLMRLDVCDVHELVLLGGIELSVDIPPEFLVAGSAAAADPLVWLWQAHQGDLATTAGTGTELLRRVVAAHPDLIEAQARLGQSLLTVPDSEKWWQWHRQLPSAADYHPEIWFVRGSWYDSHDRPREAVRCYWETVRRDPDHRAANYRLSQILTSMDQLSSAEPFGERARLLQSLESLYIALDSSPDDLNRMQKSADLTEALGRIPESAAWCRAALRRDPRLTWAEARLARLQPQLRADAAETRVLAAANPALRVDLSSYPLPEGEDPVGSLQSAQTHDDAPPTFSFEDAALATGLAFQYVNGGNPAEGTLKMYEMSGGGVAVLDCDEDCWPDVWLTQGGSWPPQPGQPDALDQLFRNSGQGGFRDVSDAAGLNEDGFSQGATAGDFDGDGFSDILVANIGQNRLCRNQGDGTFADVTQSSGINSREWTTSCLLADLNGDSWPDIYEVNYLTGDDVFTRVCRIETKRGSVGICTPGEFPAAQDRLWLSLGDGRFSDVTETSGIAIPDGKGLGIVAADFDGSGRLSLFVANDAVPNFFFANETPSRGGPVRFRETALSRGLAVDRDGAPQACMGVAAGDADNDGLLDLFVTTFHDESNTLYRQQAGQYFTDDTRRFGLREPSLKMLGFGTQFLDADGDGRQDLVLTNGHIDDYRVSGQRFRMPPQCFRNLGDGRFLEESAASLGTWFQGEYLGRSLARLDWNRDGRDDFLVSHLDAPAALLTNQTQGGPHFLAIRLRGSVSDRDAIGATVRLTAAGKVFTRQLTAGDGYQASNQRQLIFGLADVDHVDQLLVRWPAGSQQEFAGITADREILLIEGRNKAVLLPAP